MNEEPPSTYRDVVRSELNRRAEAVRTADPGRVNGAASFMVKYILSQPVLVGEFRRLVNLAAAMFSSEEGTGLCRNIEQTLVQIAEYMLSQLQTRRDALPDGSAAAVRWVGFTLPLPVAEMLKHDIGLLSRGSFSSDAEIRLWQEYKPIALRLTEAQAHLRLGEDEQLVHIWDAYHESKSKLQHLLGYEVDYAGGRAAWILARIHWEMCPDEAAGLYDNRLEPLKHTVEDAVELSLPSVKSVRNAVSEVHALLDAFLGERAAKGYLVDRLAAYFQLYAHKRVRDGIDKLESRHCKSHKIEEQVLRPVVEEFMFHHGYYALTEAQLGADRLRPDILMQEESAWFLFELKQCGFGKTEKVSATGIERKLREAVRKAERYHSLLTPLLRVQPDIYVICFVNGTAEFTGAAGALSGYTYDPSQAGVRFHLRIVNMPSSDSRAKRLPIRVASLAEISGQSPA